MTKSADIRARLDHPVIDADAHIVEAPFAFQDFFKQVAGPEIANKYPLGRKPGQVRGFFWGIPSGKYTIDRATVMLPKLYRQRLDDAGIDFAIVYTTMGIGGWMHNSAEFRQAYVRALNTMYADMFKDVQDRMTPAAVIPMNTPEEAIAELEFAVNELGFKVAALAGEVRRTIPGAPDPMSPIPAHYMSSLTIDSEHDYDPFWAKCVELKISPTAHSSTQGSSRRNSPTNYVYNRLGDFGVAGEHFARSLFLGGVTRRFPELKIGFLEGGVGWAAQLYNDLFEFWGKRNIEFLKEVMDPAKVDIELMAEMFEKYGNEYLTPERIRANPDIGSGSNRNEDLSKLDDFAACGITSEQDLHDLFVPNFYFGCEADDRMNAVAFNTKLNHLGARLKAIFSSDIGHWDVVDMTGVLEEVWEMVEDYDLITEEDFRDFVFGWPAELHASANPDFFKGTSVEDAVAKEMKSRGHGQATAAP